MDAVSTSSLYQSALLNITNSEKKEALAEAQTGSLKIASDLQGYGASAGTLVATNTLQSRVTSYIANNQAISSRLDIQDSALNQLASSAQDATTAVADAIGTGDGANLMSAVQSAMSSASAALNTQYAGSYIFAGNSTATKPFSASTLSDLTSGASVYSNDDKATTNRLNDNTVATTGFLASEVGSPIMSAMQALQTYSDQQTAAGTPLASTLSNDQVTQLQSLLTQFSSAVTDTNSTVAQNGTLQDQVSDNITSLTDQQTALKGVTGGITDADMAQVATNLTLAQTALEASAKVFTSLQSDSLLSLLSST